MRVTRWLLSSLIALHGFVHLMGFTAYLRLAQVPGLPYKTTLLGGRVELGELGAGVFGVLWGVAAVGFVLAAAALLADWVWWRSALFSVTLLSLLLTILDYGPANVGIIVNLVILVWLLTLGRTSGGAFTR